MVPALALLSIPFMASCEKDDDDNPTLQEPTEFVLNTPAIALGGNTYDLSHANTFHLTCSQPNYGFPVSTVYNVQVSFDKDFSSYDSLATTFQTASMDVKASELNDKIVEMYQDANHGEDPSGKQLSVYLRLRAHIFNSDKGAIYSNIVSVPKVEVSYVASLPTAVYIASNTIHDGGTAKQFAQVYGVKGEFYGIAYADPSAPLKWGPNSKVKKGFSDATFVSHVDGLSITADNGNVKFSKAGWYTFHFVSTIDKAKNQVITTVNVYPAQAGIIGACAGESWTDSDPNWALTVPADSKGEFVSPAFAGAGELRAYIHVPGYAWWQTEFTIFKKDLFFRNVDIPGKWEDAKGDDYSVKGSVGQKLYVDFDHYTAYVK